MKETTKRMGRPIKAPEPGARVSLGLKVTPAMKSRLAAAALSNGRTQSQEAELWLEQAFRNEERIELFRDMFFGKELSGFIELLSLILKRTINFSSYISNNGNYDRSINWMDDPFVFDQVSKAINVVLEGLRPEGDVMTTADGTPIEEGSLHVGRGLALGALVTGATSENDQGRSEQPSPEIKRILDKIGGSDVERLMRLNRIAMAKRK